MLKAIRWIIIICSVETDTLAVPTSPEHSRAGYCWHQFIQAVKNYSKGCILNKSSLNTQLAPSQPTVGADIAAESKGQGSQLPSAFSFAPARSAHPSTNTSTMGAAPVPAFATAHPEAAGLSRVWSVPREAGQRRHRNTSSNSEEPSHSFTTP